MAIVNLFSKRQAEAVKSGEADVYQYTDIPSQLRVQVKQVAIEGIGRVGSSGDGIMRGDEHNDIWVQIERIYLRENGLESIAHENFAGSRILSFMRDCSTSDWLDLLELIALGITIMAGQGNEHQRNVWQVSNTGQKAIDEINYRLREAKVGYQIEGTQLIRVDSQFMHAEVVKPALAMLSSEDFEGPRQEFIAAHQHYRVGEHRQAVAMAANALESTFKAIFDQKGWGYQKGARISDLVKVARANGLWPDYLDAKIGRAHV